MSMQDRTVGRRWMVAAAVLVGATVLAGCSPEERFRPTYLSGKSRLVGGGMRITWEAPEKGTIYLVEKETDKTIETRSLESGEAYTFAVESIVDAADLEEMLGIDFEKAEFLLYFEPAGREGPDGPTE